MATRYAFGLIYDRWKLSDSDRNRDAFTDSYGVYCVYDRQDIAEEMGVTLPTVRKAIKALIDHRILKARRAGVGAAWRYYVTACCTLTTSLPLRSAALPTTSRRFKPSALFFGMAD